VCQVTEARPERLKCQVPKFTNGALTVRFCACLRRSVSLIRGEIQDASMPVRTRAHDVAPNKSAGPRPRVKDAIAGGRDGEIQ